MTTATITLANGVELPIIGAHSNVAFFQSANRHMYDIRIPSSALTLDALNALFIADNLSEIIITETTVYEPETSETGELIEKEPKVEQFIHRNYSLVKELGLRKSEGLLFVIVAQKSDLELAQEEQAVMLLEQQDALIELAAIVG